MLCERPGYTDPEDTCFACEGRGTRRWYVADVGFCYDPCRACTGVATSGVFVLQIVTGRFRHEQNWHGADFRRAVQRAERLAEHLIGRTVLGHAPKAVRVVYLGTAGGDQSRAPEVVALLPVPARAVAAAAVA